MLCVELGTGKRINNVIIVFFLSNDDQIQTDCFFFKMGKLKKKKKKNKQCYQGRLVETTMLCVDRQGDQP